MKRILLLLMLTLFSSGCTPASIVKIKQPLPCRVSVYPNVPTLSGVAVCTADVDGVETEFICMLPIDAKNISDYVDRVDRWHTEVKRCPYVKETPALLEMSHEARMYSIMKSFP